MINEYWFVTRWSFAASAEEVFDIIAGSTDYPRWWPSVYLDVRRLEGEARRRLHTRGWLPYTLVWEAETTEVDRPRRLVIRAHGDFEGRGTWTLEQDGPFVNVTFDWKLSAEKPLLRNLSFAFKPIFAANHRWAMEQGRRSLELELARRHARSEAEQALIPPPPGPSRNSGWILGGAAVTVLLAGTMLWRKANAPHRSDGTPEHR